MLHPIIPASAAGPRLCLATMQIGTQRLRQPFFPVII
jgi:hypothetical protein